MKSSRFRSPALAIGIAIVAAACGDDGTGPAPQVVLSIETANVRGPSVRGDGPDARVRCDETFRARSTGRGSLILKARRSGLFAGVDHSTPVDVLEFSAREVQAAWDGGVLEAGTSQESAWWFELGAPFVLTGEFIYAPSPTSPNATAPVRVVCGPQVTSALAAARRHGSHRDSARRWSRTHGYPARIV